MVVKANVVEAEYLAEEQYDANDPLMVNKARQVSGRKKKKSIEVMSALMQHRETRDWLYALLQATDVFRLSYLHGESHSDIAFREGKRFIGLQLLADIRLSSPENFALMLEEASDIFPNAGVM
jgi:hypothetical protein